MLALQIDDTKEFTRKLFLEDTFDNFLCTKASLSHNINYEINGRINEAFYSSDERELHPEEFIKWTDMKPILTNMIKGKHLPLSFTIVLTVSKEALAKMYNMSSHDYSLEQVEGLFVNILYKDNEILLTTGSSYSIFSMDKTLDHVFEENLKILLKRAGVSFE